MIVLRLRGRLGNQLFIYAFGRSLQEKFNDELVLLDNENDTGGTILNQFRLPNNVKIVPISYGYKYDYYNMKASDYKKISNRIINSIKKEIYFNKQCKNMNIPQMSFIQKIDYFMYKVNTRKKSRRECYNYEIKNSERLNKAGLYICENGYVEFKYPKKKNIFAFGYFQSTKYFKDIEKEIKKEIRPKKELRNELMPFIDEIKEGDSVCLSIRMGDYIKNPIHGVCSQKYYQAAIDKMYELHPNAKIFVFSDDVEAVKETYSFKNNVFYEPDGCNELEKITYMSMCKHFILSNSSFSWWTQYLCSYEKKTVIAPEKWYAVDIPCDIYEDNWILLSV